MSAGEAEKHGGGQAVQNRLLHAALQYVRSGTPVFPLNGKVPFAGTHGFLEATLDEKKILELWSKWPDANIGSPTGRQFVLDIDLRHGGHESLAALEKAHWRLPATREARTGGGGRHLYFLVPDGLVIRSSAGKLGPGLDIRAAGAYVVLPPSVHPDTKRRYEWTNLRDPEIPPEWLLNLLREPPRAKTNGANSAASDSEKIPEGQRNATLASNAGAMRRRGSAPAAIEALLLVDNAQRCDPPLAESEVRAIAKSVGRYEPQETSQAKSAVVSANPWDQAESLEHFLTSGEDCAEFLDADKRILARGAITEIFSPRGLGKSLYAIWLALELLRRGLRVLYIDRDNPTVMSGRGSRVSAAKTRSQG
jgi:hypothetical protein